MSNAWAGGSTTAWRKLRLLVLERDHYQCQIKLPGTWVTGSGIRTECQVIADCVHHTLGKAITGDDPAYLQAACTPCNQRLGDPAKQPDPPNQPITNW